MYCSRNIGKFKYQSSLACFFFSLSNFYLKVITQVGLPASENDVINLGKNVNILNTYTLKKSIINFKVFVYKKYNLKEIPVNFELIEALK